MPPMPKSDKIWYNGELVNWDAANVHVLSHVVHYGSSVFDGIRCYNTEKGPAVFSSRRARRSAFRFGEDLPDGDTLYS